MNFGKITTLNELLVFFSLLYTKSTTQHVLSSLSTLVLSDQHAIKHLSIFKIY